MALLTFERPEDFLLGIVMQTEEDRAKSGLKGKLGAPLSSLHTSLRSEKTQQRESPGQALEAGKQTS